MSQLESYDDALSEFLDGDTPERADLRGIPKEEIARHLVVAGVTRHLLSEPGARTENLVRAGMDAVLASERERRGRRSRWLGGLAAAAAVVVTALALYPRAPRDEQAVIDRIRGFVTDDIDREYKVSLTSRRAGRLPFEPTLYVRGTDRYAAGADLSFAGQTFPLWQGFNGTDRWLVVPNLGRMLGGRDTPVFVTSGSADLWAHEEVRTIRRLSAGLDQMESALEIFSLLADFERDYRIETTPPTASAIPRGKGQVDLTAYRHPQASITIPDTIRIIVEEDTGVVRTVVLTFVELPDARFENPFLKIRYDLVRETIAGDGLYEHDSYHDPNRPVVDR